VKLKINKKKIIHIISGLNSGGAEFQLYKLITNSSKFDCAIISLTDKGYYGELIEKAGIKVYCVNLKNSTLIKGIKNYLRIIKIENPDIFHTWMEHSHIFGGLIPYTCNFRKIIWSVRTGGEYVQDKISYRILHLMNSCFSYLIPKVILFNSKNTMHGLTFSYFDKKKHKYIPNGIYDLNKDKFKLKNNLREKSKNLICGMIARWSIEKGHETLFKAVSLLPGNLKKRRQH
tara:strand:- start:947 stop:1639 length:693 start_codon:yes stop_codon:yes gene_type:complete